MKAKWKKRKPNDIFFAIFYDDAWICDPKKCPNCPKTVCHGGYCYHTTVKEERATGIRRFIFFLQYLIFGAPSWSFRYRWLYAQRRHKKGEDNARRE